MPLYFDFIYEYDSMYLIGSNVTLQTFLLHMASSHLILLAQQEIDDTRQDTNLGKAPLALSYALIEVYL